MQRIQQGIVVSLWHIRKELGEELVQLFCLDKLSMAYFEYHHLLRLKGLVTDLVALKSKLSETIFVKRQYRAAFVKESAYK